MPRLRFSGWLASAPLVYLGVFFLIPILIIVGFSFLRRDFYGGVVPQFSLDAWSEAVTADTRSLVRSLGLALGVTAICLVISYPCALALGRLEPDRRRLVLLGLTFPLFTSQLLRVYGWMNLLPLEWLGTLGAVGLVLAVNYLPFMLLPIVRSLERLSDSLTLAAADLGANRIQAFWRIVWPLTRPGRWAGCTLVFVPVCGEFLVPSFIGEGKVQVLGTRIEEAYTQRHFPYAAVLGVWLLALVALPALFSVFRREQTSLSRTRREESGQ